MKNKFKMKNKFNVFFLFVASFFTFLLPFSTVSAGVLTPGSFVPTQYDPSVSIFDKYGYDIILMSNCDSTYYYDSDTQDITTNQPTNGKKLCSTSQGISLDDLKQYFKYYIHVSYQDEVDGKEYDTYLAFINQPYLKVYQTNGFTKGILTDINGNSNNLKGVVLLNHYAYSSVHTVSDSDTQDFRVGAMGINGNYYSGMTRLNGFIDWVDTDSSHPSFSFQKHNKFDLYNLMNYNPEYLSITVHSNFDLLYYNSNDIYVSGTDGFAFDTDVDITIPSQNFLLLIPKREIAFTSYLWTDTNFLYEYSVSDCVGSYTDIGGGALDSISFGALNGFNWFRWDFTFTQEEINSHKVLQLYNHSTGDLHIKLFDEDFYYYIMKDNSNSVTVNSCNYGNNYSSLNETASHHVINNSYNVDTFNDGMDYLNSLPSLITTFSKSFVFIGNCITSFFQLCTTELQMYFYIIFGLLIVMLIINVLK